MNEAPGAIAVALRGYRPDAVGRLPSCTWQASWIDPKKYPRHSAAGTFPVAKIPSSAASSSTGTPSDSALASFDPAPGPATT